MCCMAAFHQTYQQCAQPFIPVAVCRHCPCCSSALHGRRLRVMFISYNVRLRVRATVAMLTRIRILANNLTN